MKTWGYFDSSDQSQPTFDPGLNIPCPLCNRRLFGPKLKTVSLMLMDDKRSYFYRVHAACYEQADINEVEAIESALIDAIASTRNVN